MCPEAAGSRTGRPRSDSADRAILTTARRLLLEHGYGGLSMEAVASSAGVAKTTVYRRWPTKDHLVFAVVAALQDETPLPDTGDVRRDLVELATGIIATLSTETIPGLAAELVAAAGRDPELAGMFRKLWACRREAAFAVLYGAMDAGRLRPDIEPAVVIDQLAGAIYYRLLITGDPLDGDYAARLVDHVLSGAGGGGTGS